MPETAPGFTHLHNHTTYSLLDGAQRLDEMLARAASDGQEALAITDHGNLFGVLEFAREAAVQRVLTAEADEPRRDDRRDMGDGRYLGGEGVAQQ